MDATITDSTTLSTRQILREITSLEVLFERELKAQEKLLEQKITAVEKAVDVAHANLVRVPTDVDKAVGQLEAVMLEKFNTMSERFNSIQTQFKERDSRVEQTAKDSKLAVDAALQAAKEMVGAQQANTTQVISKIESSTVKQYDSLSLLIASGNNALDGKVSDIKERLTKIEGQDRGSQLAERTQQGKTSSTTNIASLVVGSLIGIAGVIMMILSFMKH